MVEFSAEQSDQKLRATFFRGVTLVTSVSALILAGSEGSIFPAAVTPIVAVISWVLVDHFRILKVPVLVGNICGLVALWIAADEFWGGTTLRKLLSGAHLVVYLSWIVLLLPKSHRQYWWLMALSVLQLAIGGIVSGDVAFGAALVGMMLLMLWTMSVFSLFRVQDQHAHGNGDQISENTADVAGLEASRADVLPDQRSARAAKFRKFLQSFLGLRSIRSQKTSESGNTEKTQNKPVIVVRNGLQRDASETWVGWRFRGMVSVSYVVSLILAFFVFAAFPRVWIPGIVFGDMAAEQMSGAARPGISNSVALGDVGRIMLSNARVLAFDAENLRTQKPMTAEELAAGTGMDDIRFRGNVFARYYDGHWIHGYSLREGAHEDGLYRPGSSGRSPDFRVNIVQDPPQELFAYAPYPVSRIISSRRTRVIATERRSCLIWQNLLQDNEHTRSFSVELSRAKTEGELLFETWRPPVDLPPEHLPEFQNRMQATAERMFLTDGIEWQFTQSARGMLVTERRVYVPEKDLPNSLPALYELANNICTEQGQVVSPDECVRRITAFLSPENGFRYSLTPSRKDTSRDPVEDFLLNTKSGHCEYFASACTLMLQAVRVPARLVTGFYGSELNSVTGKYEIRQRNAHAWTETWYDGRWHTVEATPGADRDALLAEGTSIGLMSNLQDAISDFWNDGIHNMSAQRQQEFFAPVISTSKSLYDTIQEQGVLATVRQGISQFASSPEKWVSWQGGVVTFLLLAAIAGLIRVRAFQRLLRLLKTLVQSRSSRDKSLKSMIRFYEGFCTLCERHGVQLAPSNSALENAEIATKAFRDKIQSTEILSLPMRIADAFNQVRFGNQPLTEEQTAVIGKDLQQFAELLK